MNGIILEKVFCLNCGAIVSSYDQVEFDLSRFEDKELLNEVRNCLGLKALDYEAILKGEPFLARKEDLHFIPPQAVRRTLRANSLDNKTIRYECYEINYDEVLKEIETRIQFKNKLLKKSRYNITVKALKPVVSKVGDTIQIKCPSCGNVLATVG